MHFNEMFPSQWLKASDFDDGPQILTVHEVTREEIGQGKKRAEKTIVYFEETQKGLVLNVTNGRCIADSYGPRSENWIGGQVELFGTKVPFGSEMVDGIRLRIPKEPSADELVDDSPPPPATAGAQGGNKKAAEPEGDPRSEPPPADLDDEIPF